MDINEIRSKLGEMNKPKAEKKEKIDFSLYIWKPKQKGKYQIRILDSVLNKKYPFKEVFIHYGIGRFPIYSLVNWGEKDPIVEFAKKLRSGDFDKEKWVLAKKLDPKMRIFAPIIVRGEEDKGVRLWEFGKEIYTQLLKIAEDEDYGNYTDVESGHDFTLEAIPDTVGGKDGLKSTILIKPKPSPLSKNPEEVEKWLNEQPNILELQSKYKYSFEKLKELLANFLEEPQEEEPVQEEKNYSPKQKQSKSEQFDDLFADEQKQ